MSRRSAGHTSGPDSRRPPAQRAPRARPPGKDRLAAARDLERAVERPLYAAFVELVADAPVAAFVKDPDGRYVYANEHLQTTVFAGMGGDWFGKTDLDLWPPKVARLVQTTDRASVGEGSLQVFVQEMPIGDAIHTFLLMKIPLRLGEEHPHVAGIALDQTEQNSIVADRDLLATVVEQSGDSVMIADVDARITYVNAAFERATGYSREEVIGKNPRILKSGAHPASFYEGMWASLASGGPWASDFVNRRKDGTLLTEEATIWPITDPNGTLVNYVAVKRDVSRQRELEERTQRLTRERAVISQTLQALGPGDTPEATAYAVIHQVLNLSGVAAAQLFIFEADGQAVPIGFGVAGQPDPPLHRLPSIPSHELRQRAALGPWIQSWVARPVDSYYEQLKGLGPHLVAAAPMRSNDELIGLLVIDATESTSEAVFSESLAALVEFANVASALIGRDIADRSETKRARAAVRAILAEKSFHPVFQPIVQLDSRTVLGYEALTRFSDGVGPEVRFTEASALGMGIDFETATLTAIFAEARKLKRTAWLSVNASPALIIAGDAIRAMIQRTKRDIVVEVTEHAAIENYATFRAAVANLGPRAQLAVDDAGAGFASLRHILELRPSYVKLDRSLIAGVDSDDARRAMIVGLRHFAQSVSCELIAEGVETEEELAVLVSLGITVGQGFLLGRPTPAGAMP